MNKKEKQQYLQDRINLIKDSVVTDLKTEIIGNECLLREIRLKHPSGNEFTIKPHGTSQSGLHITQVLWGYTASSKAE